MHAGTVYECPAELYRALREVWNRKHEAQQPDKPWTFSNEDAGPDLVPSTSPYE